MKLASRGNERDTTTSEWAVSKQSKLLESEQEFQRGCIRDHATEGKGGESGRASLL